MARVTEVMQAIAMNAVAAKIVNDNKLNISNPNEQIYT